MKKIIALLALGILFSTNLKAADEIFPATVVGIVDLEKIQSASTLYKGITKEKEKYINQQKPILEAKDKEFKKVSEALLKEKATLSEAEFNEKATKFANEVNLFKNKVAKENIEFQSRINETLVEAAAKSLQPAIAEIATKHGVTLVLNTTQTIYFNQTVNMSDEVIELLNKKHPKIDLKTPAKKAPAKKKN